MSLVVAASGSEATQIRARWVSDRAGRRTQRLLAWREENAEYQVRAVFHDESPRNPSLEELLALLERRTGRQGGRTTLADGTAAIWLPGTAEDGTDTQLDMAWDCDLVDAAASRFALNVRLPALRQGDRQQFLDRLAARLYCSAAN